jgi:hypothetical protein
VERPLEAVDLADWITTLCNGTWQDQFNFYGHQAQEDWWQWMLPWNWTVQFDNTTNQTERGPFRTNSSIQFNDTTRRPAENPSCPGPKYFVLFAVENVIFFLALLAWAWCKVWWIQLNEESDAGRLSNTAKTVSKAARRLFKPFTWVKNKLAYLFHGCKESPGSSGLGDVISVIFIATMLSSVQLGFNFGAAYYIKHRPGYEHVPAPLLALLFCARPRISWLACLVSQIGETRLQRYFHLSGKGLADANTATIKVALSSAVSEIIMQGLGAYSLGRTADVGRRRGFYLARSLSPFWHGYRARIMYLGALAWLVLCFFIFLTWFLVARFHAPLVQFWASTADWFKSAKKNVKHIVKNGHRLKHYTVTRAVDVLPIKVEPILDQPIKVELKPDQPIKVDGSSNQPIKVDKETDQPIQVNGLDAPDGHQNMLRGDESHIPSSSTDIDSQPIQDLLDRAQGDRQQAGDGEETSPTHPDHLRPPQPAPTGIPSPTLPDRDQTILPRDTKPEEAEVLSSSVSPLSLAPIAESGTMSAATTSTLVNPHFPDTTSTPDVPTIYYAPSSTEQSHQDGQHPQIQHHVRDVRDDTTLVDAGADEKAATPTTPANFSPPEELEALQRWVLKLAVHVGFFSMFTQWLFWVGFVTTAGEKYVSIGTKHSGHLLT